jgi:endonuclease YncB( thermonuclease family)
MSRSWSGKYRRAYLRPRRSPLRRFLDYTLTVAIFGLLFVVSARLGQVELQVPPARAIVNDGDSLTIGSERVRLRGIDAPELNQTCVKDGESYACGRRSREALFRLVSGKAVSCSGSEHDRYGRLLARCEAGGIDLNREQVEAGWAIAYGDYAEEEDKARQQQLGLWAGRFERPRDWRDSRGGMTEGAHDFKGRLLDRLRHIIHFS